MRDRCHRSRFSGWHCQSLEPRRLLAVQPLGDINTAPLSAYDGIVGIVAVNETVYFAVDDALHGRELWRTDPDGGASLVKDIYPGSFGSNPGSLTAIGDRLYFTADAPGHGREVWTSDGTTAGTKMVADLLPGVESSRPGSFGRLGDAVYFITTSATGLAGAELWRTDGTSAGTSVVRQVNPPAFPDGVLDGRQTPVVANGRLLFATSASAAAGGGALWASDGTAHGTQPIKSFPAGGGPTGLAVTANGTLFFVAPGAVGAPALWKSNGTPAATVQVGAVRPNFDGRVDRFFTPVGNSVYFRGEDTVHGRELWTSDGTDAGTRLVKDIAPGALSSLAGNIAAGNDGSVYFVARNEMWKTSGTAAGTAPLTTPGTGASYSFFSTAAGPFVYFADEQSGLYRTDGTPAGTTLVRRFSRLPGPIIAVGNAGEACFYADDGASGVELWRTDGTAAGTRLVEDVYAKTENASPTFLGTLGADAYFWATHATHGRALWKTDGTPAGTSLVRDINPASFDSGPRGVLFGDALYFPASDRARGNELWRTDGTGAGTYLVKNLTPETGPTPASSTLEGFTVLGGGLYFTKSGALYRTDGTDAGTVLVNDEATFALHGVVNGRLLLSGTDPTHGTELWSSDGTGSGTARLTNVNAYGVTDPPVAPRITADGATAFFFADAQSGAGNQLWKTDGTADGTVPVADVAPGSDDWNGDGMAVVGSRLFFGRTSYPSAELWVTDGTVGGTSRVKHFPANIWPSSFANLDGILVFSLEGSLWRSDGTEAGTFAVANVGPLDSGRNGSTDWVVHDGTVYFLAGPFGTLWKSDGSAVGTVAVSNLRFPAFVSPRLRTISLGDTLLLAGDDRLHGREVWRLIDDGRAPVVTGARFVDPGGGAPPRLEFTFDQPLAPPIDGYRIRITDRVTDEGPTHSYFPVEGGPVNVVAVEFPTNGGVMPAGPFRAVLFAGTVAALDGDALARDYSFEFTTRPAQVVGRHVFHNRSAADGNDPAADRRDDSAIAPTRALLPGGPADAANVSHYSRGINGIMIDVAGLPDLSRRPVGPDDFELTVGDGTTWSPAPRPLSVSYEVGAGANYSTRVTILWPDGAVRNQWLRVSVLPTANTGLSSPDIFYFGNLVGDTGDSAPGVAPVVNVRDLAAVRGNVFSTNPAALARYDFNHDGVINAIDVAIARGNLGATLKQWTAPATPPAQPASASLPPITPSRRGALCRRAADYVLDAKQR